MLDILSVTGVIFALILLGWGTTRAGLFGRGELATLGKYVVNFALPALIFRAVSSRDLTEILNPGYLVAMLVGSVSVFALGYGLARGRLGMSAGAATFQGMGMSCANSGFVGYPMLLMALPGIASTALALNMIVENLVMIPLILILAERAGEGALRGRALAAQIAGRLAKNPIVLALLAGLAVSLGGVELPVVLARPVGLIAESSAAVSLIVIGGTLAGLHLGAINLSVALAVAGKLVLHPLAVALGLLAVAAAGYGVGDPDLARAAILVAATPAMAIYPILAQRYGQQDVAALAMLVMTALSFVTLTAILWLLEHAPLGALH